VHGPISSIYRWQGATERTTEWYCHLKTTAARLAALQARIGELHPYEVPEIISVPIYDGNADYLSWVAESVG